MHMFAEFAYKFSKFFQRWHPRTHLREGRLHSVPTRKRPSTPHWWALSP